MIINLNMLLPILSLLILIPTAPAAVYQTHYCGSNTTTYIPKSTYQTNLQLLLSSLSSDLTLTSRYFSNATTGRDSPNIVYGLSLCRTDILPNDCRNCLLVARDEIVKLCPNQKEAIIWHDECMVRYSNRSVLSFMEDFPYKHVCNSANISEQVRAKFQQVVRDTMDALAIMATGDPARIAVEEANFNRSQKVYGLVQCTPDLSGFDCNRCLRTSVARLPQFCSGRQGGRILTPSCSVRYEIYKFNNLTPSAKSPSSSTRTRGKKKISLLKIVASICGFLVVFGIGLLFVARKSRRRRVVLHEEIDGSEIANEQSLQFDLGTIKAATSDFSVHNEIGEGGFGAVYKGVLSNGQEIAVKRLSRSSGQGAQEFKNEVVLVAKLQHRNLVRLWGFCLEAEEKILIYEYVTNKSLDYFLFDPKKQGQLDWPRRYKIIGGIARGMLYLHEDSRLRIIHRDLKASNILLDEDMNAKISDFGMARIFCVNQTQASTNRIVGTVGYMSPEYAMHGYFSVKSDVFSFGVLLLEIISGKRNTSFYEVDRGEDLLCFAWKQWRDGSPLELMDPTLMKSFSRDEVIRCINIGLLCVQENVDARPSMASIVLMLNSNSVALPLPQKPPFFVQGGTESMIFKELDTDQSTSRSISGLFDHSSFTQLHPHD